jgi:hypothetical protein
LIDLDRAGSCKDPATDDEIKEAAKVADGIAEWFQRFGDAETFRVMSGNGIHLYYALDLPNDGDSEILCQTLLRALAGKFDTDVIKVDRAVFDAARITKVPGTFARKGVESPERPYRRAIIL